MLLGLLFLICKMERVGWVISRISKMKKKKKKSLQSLTLGRGWHFRSLMGRLDPAPSPGTRAHGTGSWRVGSPQHSSPLLGAGAGVQRSHGEEMKP